jgi:hypothetical protein
MQTTTSLHDARCKQRYECHIRILQIFLINFHIKYILFRDTVWKIRILQVCTLAAILEQKRRRPGIFSPRCLLAAVADRRGQSADAACWLERGFRGGADSGWRPRPICQFRITTQRSKKKIVWLHKPELRFDPKASSETSKERTSKATNESCLLSKATAFLKRQDGVWRLTQM